MQYLLIWHFIISSIQMQETFCNSLGEIPGISQDYPFINRLIWTYGCSFAFFYSNMSQELQQNNIMKGSIKLSLILIGLKGKKKSPEVIIKQLTKFKTPLYLRMHLQNKKIQPSFQVCSSTGSFNLYAQCDLSDPRCLDSCSNVQIAVYIQ